MAPVTLAVTTGDQRAPRPAESPNGGSNPFKNPLAGGDSQREWRWCVHQPGSGEFLGLVASRTRQVLSFQKVNRTACRATPEGPRHFQRRHQIVLSGSYLDAGRKALGALSHVFCCYGSGMLTRGVPCCPRNRARHEKTRCRLAPGWRASWGRSDCSRRRIRTCGILLPSGAHQLRHSPISITALIYLLQSQCWQEVLNYFIGVSGKGMRRQKGLDSQKLAKQDRADGHPEWSFSVAVAVKALPIFLVAV